MLARGELVGPRKKRLKELKRLWRGSAHGSVGVPDNLWRIGQVLLVAKQAAKLTEESVTKDIYAGWLRGA